MKTITRLEHVGYDTLNAAIEAAEGCGSGEVVHIHADGEVTTGTDYGSTHPSDTWEDDIYVIFCPGIAPDPWDCLENVQAKEPKYEA